jgi:hypothetical protein
MEMRYRLEVVRDWLTSDSMHPRIRVIENFDDYSDNATFSILLDDFGNKILPEMESWCITNDCGYRVEHDMFKFLTDEELTMFMLRWS